MKRLEHIWVHGDREWKATPDGLWARPVGREHWTFEAWFTPVVDEILKLKKALDESGKAPLSLVPSADVVKEPDPEAWQGKVNVGLPAAGPEEPYYRPSCPTCMRCGCPAPMDIDTCPECGLAL